MREPNLKVVMVSLYYGVHFNSHIQLKCMLLALYNIILPHVATYFAFNETMLFLLQVDDLLICVLKQCTYTLLVLYIYSNYFSSFLFLLRSINQGIVYSLAKNTPRVT